MADDPFDLARFVDGHALATFTDLESDAMWVLREQAADLAVHGTREGIRLGTRPADA